MLCELVEVFDEPFRLVKIWAAVSLMMLLVIFASSGLVFYHLYWPSKVTYDKWRFKSNPVYPPVEKVRDEIMQMLKGMICSAIFPSLSLYFANTSLSQTFCGWGGYSLSYHVMTTFVVWLGSDFFEFFYHRLGHVDFRFWKQVRWQLKYGILQLLEILIFQHKHHHVFFNPSPFAVIADEWADQLMRSSPLFVIPLLMPVNMDMLFITYAAFFYFYGVYLHSGHELESLSAHNAYFNTSFQVLWSSNIPSMIPLIYFYFT